VLGVDDEGVDGAEDADREAEVELATLQLNNLFVEVQAELPVELALAHSHRPDAGLHDVRAVVRHPRLLHLWRRELHRVRAVLVAEVPAVKLADAPVVQRLLHQVAPIAHQRLRLTRRVIHAQALWTGLRLHVLMLAVVRVILADAGVLIFDIGWLIFEVL
jgi:hypothetical protein